MGYIRAEEILPLEVIRLIQQYVDGENVYIPRKDGSRQQWGAKTRIRQEMSDRNLNIYRDFLAGHKVERIASDYYLSVKSIQRIVREMKVNID